ncbi:ribonuclease Z [Cesiribacter andamanensis]|uniref:Ribonuclease Z n=1 Tax=Cesiribacter andamanensis AMV16 TaxID=1279009 RepID=M7N6S9_9BACT|nr:ribonuclease Z [Cesiribacter andamanensis]EMR04298.1 Ribonuclease Z [Cesiribacter andamanensis AMV16]
MAFQVKILGSNSATPAHNRNQTSQLLIADNEYYLIDCGEGTQLQLIRYRIRFHRINHIFISHLHGDHYLGLMGLLLTMNLQGRQEDLHVYGPAGLDEILSLQMKYSGTILQYKLHFTAVEQSAPGLLFESKLLTVESLPLVHRIPCTGFLFREKPKSRRFNRAKMQPGMTGDEIARLKSGQDIYTPEGELKYRSLDYTLPPRRSRSYAYCSDTRYEPALVPLLQNVDVLYHEATFTSEFESRAAETFHSTARQAGLIAQAANAHMLLLGHYSVRYKELTPLLLEAREVFYNSYLAVEGETIDIGAD